MIATKCGIKLVDGKQVRDGCPEVIRKSAETSLKNLGVDVIDLYCLHRIDPNTPIKRVAETMRDLMRQGKIRHWGLSEASADTIRSTHAVCPLTAIQSKHFTPENIETDKRFKAVATLSMFNSGIVRRDGFLDGQTSTIQERLAQVSMARQQ